MPVLDISEYNDIYFGDHPTLKHIAGYTNYDLNETRIHGTAPIDGGEQTFWATDNERLSLSILNRYTNNGQKVMVVGCAKGYLVEWLLSFGLDVYGIDVSQHAINSGIARNPSLSGRISQGDVRTVSVTDWVNNQWDLLISRNTLSCFTDTELNSNPNGLISRFNKTSRDQFHLISPGTEDSYYNRKSLVQWISLGWEQGTVIAQKTGVGFDFEYLVK